MKRFAVDPGLNGGICVSEGLTLSLYNMPVYYSDAEERNAVNSAALQDIFTDSYHKLSILTIEQQNIRPSWMVKDQKTEWGLALNYGAVLSIGRLHFKEELINLVSPKAWIPKICHEMNADKWSKDVGKAFFEERSFGLNIRLKPAKMTDGITDAFCIWWVAYAKKLGLE